MVTSDSCSSNRNFWKSLANCPEWSTKFSSSISLYKSPIGGDSALFSNSGLVRRCKLPKTEYLCWAELFNRETCLCCCYGDWKVWFSFKKSSSAALYRLPLAPTIYPATAVFGFEALLVKEVGYLEFEPNRCHIILNKFLKIMSITLQRSKREVQFEMSKLPTKIGPGTYDSDKFPKEVREW